MKGHTLGSLFTGIRGLDLGLEAAGFRTIWACDNHEACQRIIRRSAPGVPLVDDVAKIGAEQEPPDLLAGGFPCPDFSYAGNRLLFTGERAQLWYEMARAVRVLRPKLVIVENVPGLLTALGVVLADLAEAGYVGCWMCLRASDIGAPHKRERVFVVAADPEQPGVNADRLLHRGGPAGRDLGRRAPLPPREEVARPEDAVEDRPGAPPDAERIGRYGGGAGDEEGPAGGEDGRAEPPRPPEASSHAGGPRREGAEPEQAGRRPRPPDGAVDWGPYREAVERWESLFGRPAPRPTDTRGRLDPAFVEWMLGFPEGWTTGERRAVRLRMLGNSVQVQVAELVGQLAAEALACE